MQCRGLRFLHELEGTPVSCVQVKGLKPNKDLNVGNPTPGPLPLPQLEATALGRVGSGQEGHNLPLPQLLPCPPGVSLASSLLTTATLKRGLALCPHKPPNTATLQSEACSPERSVDVATAHRKGALLSCGARHPGRRRNGGSERSPAGVPMEGCPLCAWDGGLGEDHPAGLSTGKRTTRAECS